MAGDLDALSTTWAALGGAPSLLDDVVLQGAAGGLPSVYAVAETATAQVGVATLAASELLAARGGGRRRAIIDRRHVIAAFRSERYLRPIGWTIPMPWDPIAGDYETKDGWIRLHTNYASHRDAALRALGATAEREAVARATGAWEADALEAAVVAAGGCAAAMHTCVEWAIHPQGVAVAIEPLVAVARSGGGGAALDGSPESPLDGVRVLDLTRVIAGPVCTRFLAAHGAEVIRVDPPGFAEVSALLPDTTAGKKRVALDLRAPDGRRAFDRLVATAHVVVSGYRSDALRRLGYDVATLRGLNPSLIVALIDAYGWTGPWHQRRGFDSLVQMTSGIAARGAEMAGSSKPFPLPAQALDHGTGYLLAAATCRALTRLVEEGEISELRASLARTARWLVDAGERGDLGEPDFTADDASPWLERTESAWGELERVRCPGQLEGTAPQWAIPPGPLGTDAASWG